MSSDVKMMMIDVEPVFTIDLHFCERSLFTFCDLRDATRQIGKGHLHILIPSLHHLTSLHVQCQQGTASQCVLLIVFPPQPLLMTFPILQVLLAETDDVRPFARLLRGVGFNSVSVSDLL